MGKGGAGPTEQPRKDPTRKKGLTSGSPEVIPAEEVASCTPRHTQDIGISSTTEHDLSPGSTSTVPVRKWYQIDFNPTAFCKKVFKSVYSESTTRSGLSAQKTNRSDRRDVIPEIKSVVLSNTTEKSFITGPPSFQKPMEDLRVERGDAAAFIAHVAGFPAPEASWYKDGKLLSASQCVKLTENSPQFSLTLLNAGSADSGMYTCTARNVGGEASCSALLTVERGFGEGAVCSTVMKRQRRSLQSLYEIHEEIGRGSFGIVKRVTSRESGEGCAAKFLTLRKDSRRRAFQERDLLAQITHPRVACLLDSFHSQRTLVLLTELCSSHGLLDHLLSKVTVKEREMGIYIQHVSEAIEHIHRLNILHLDINPTNILMTLEKEAVKICDFGFSQKIDPSRYQYSKYGTPEFVAPEIVCQAPVTKATDIWSLGVLSYLCLTCHCPFSGESDRATLLRVREGKVFWDSSDITSRSRPAQDFLQRLLHPEPHLRPTAAECLSHEWLQGQQADQESADIITKNLTLYMSRSKLQRSQICYGSGVKQQTIADLLAALPQETSLVGSPTKLSLDSSSISSGSSSEYDEMDDWAIPLPISNESRESRHLEAEDPEPPDGIIALETPNKERQTQEEMTWWEDTSEQDSQRGVLTVEWPISQLTQGHSPSSQGMADEGSTGGRVPRESLIKSTFYSSSEELSPLSARRILLRQKKRTNRMERSRARLRSGFSCRLGEPLLEHVEDSAEEGEGRTQRKGSPQSSVPLTKSCSFDSGPVACSNTQRPPRSRSLDEYSSGVSSTSELKELGKDEDKNYAFRSQEVLEEGKEDSDAFSERWLQSADTVVETQEVLKDPYFEKAKDSSEFASDEIAEVHQPTTDDSTEADVPECISSDSPCLSEDIKEITSSACPAEKVDGSVNTELWKDTKDHSTLKSVLVDSTMPVSIGQDISESLASNSTLSILQRPSSMDLSFETLETLNLETSAQLPMIHKVRSDEVISKPSDLALLAPKPEERPRSAVCSMSALEDACAFKKPSSKERDTVETLAGISIKLADFFQELSLCAPADEELCDSIANTLCFVPEPVGKPSCSKDDYEMVDPAEEGYPGLLEDKESLGYVAHSIPNLHDRFIKEESRGAEALPSIIISYEGTEVLEETMRVSSSGKDLPYMHQESTKDNESDLELKDLLEEIHTYEDHDQEEIHNYEDHDQMITTEKSGWSDSSIPEEVVESSPRSSSLKVLRRGSIDIEGELQRYPSTPSLETKAPSGKSGRIMEFFRQHSWTSQSCSPVERVVKRQASEGDASDFLLQQQEKLKRSDLSITKRVRATVSCFSKSTLGRQTSKEDKEDNVPIQETGVGMKSSPPSPCGNLQRPSSMDLSFEALETLDLENSAQFSMIHKVRSDEVISKPSDLALLAPKPKGRPRSAVCSMSALEDACGFKKPSSMERDTVETPAGISIKPADSFQELSLGAVQDEELCDSVANVQCFVPEPAGKPSCSVDDYDMVDSAEEGYPGLLEDKESHGYVARSITNLHDRYIKEESRGAEALPSIIISYEGTEVLEETMRVSSSGKDLPYMHQESTEDNESDLELKDLLEEIHTYEDHDQEDIHNYEDHDQMITTEKSGWSDSGIPEEVVESSARSGSLKVFHGGSIDIEGELQRYPSTPSLETKAPSGKSGRIMEFFRQHSWTSQSCSPVEKVVKRQASEGDSSDALEQQQEKLKRSDLSITKRVRATVSCFSKSMLGRQTSREDEEDGVPVQEVGVGMKSSPPSPCDKSIEVPAVSPKRSPGIISFKLSGFRRSKSPVFLEELTDQGVSLGQEAMLRCRLSGHPPPDVQWFKEARRLQTSDHIRLAVTDREYLSLTVYSAKEEDLGSYRCVASNAMGQASTSCTLIVSELPTCPTGVQVYQLQGDEVLLVWKPVESITELSYCIEYNRDGSEWRLLAEGITDSYYTASILAKGALYQFRVACLNRAGKGSFSEPSVPFTIRAEQQDLLAPLIYTESTGSLELTGQAQFSLFTQQHTYNFLSEINRGRFSVVKQCQEDQSGQLLAGKITPFKPNWRHWALREYQLLRRLNHANLVQLHVAFITPRYLVLILELCQGQDLFNHLAERDLYGETHVQAFLQQILSVTNYMHRRRVAHLDLKSDNILVTGQSILKVVDLGSAHVFTPGQPVFPERLLEISESKAPEVLEGHGMGPETDIWAIGVLAFIMLSGDEPFHTESHCEHSMKKGKLQFGRCYSGLSEEALNFMKRALHTKPQSRPSAAECLQLPWIQGARQPSRCRDAAACFTTDKLRAYLQERELRRWHAHAKLEARHTQLRPRFPSSPRRHSDCD